MQPNIITLSVDKLNNGTTANESYNRFEEFANRSVYIGADHTLCLRNNLTLYRTMPTLSGNFRGVAKSAFKFSQDHTVLGVDGVSSITAPVIVEVKCSVPVGVTDAQSLYMRQRALALLDLDSIMQPLSSTLMI